MDFEDGLDKLKVHSSVAADISAFMIWGNGRSSVPLTQTSAPAVTIVIADAAALNMTAGDFLLYEKTLALRTVGNATAGAAFLRETLDFWPGT